jgi:hypothetical protein
MGASDPIITGHEQMYRTVWLTDSHTIGASDYRSDPVWLTYHQKITTSDYKLDPVTTWYYALDSLTDLPSDNRGVGLQVGPRHYWILCIGQSDIRGVGLQVGPVNTGYYASDSLTYVPSENRASYYRYTWLQL